MSTYRDLLLSTGGGVIGSRQMDEQEKCATIAIGLGGTGVSCLKNLKRQVYSRLQPDDPEAAVPVYKHIKFLAVDTDKNSLYDKGKKHENIMINSLDEVTEFFDISTSAISALLEETKTMATRPEFTWLRTANENTREQGLRILSADAGAGGVRQIGRLLMIQKSAAFVEKIQQLIREAKTELPGGSDVNIHIFTGMGGGTGSGTFLDVCYLVQQALRNEGEWGHALTCGYFFLPDVNLSVPQVSANPAISEYIKVNGFAAMKELDYCMNFANNGGKWEQQYMGFHFGPISEPPVKICHLISATTTSGATLDRGYDYAMNVVSDFIMQFVVKNAITMKSHIANYFRAMGNVRKEHGANYTYCLLGASNAVVPMREITTYLASRLFEGMAQKGGKLPTDGEIAQIAQNNGLTYQQLQKSILEKTSCQMPKIELDYKLFTSMSEEDLGMEGKFILPETVIKPYEKVQENMVNRIEANMQALTQEWSWDRIKSGDETSVSKVCRLYFSLANIVSDPDCGPKYAAVVLNGSARQNLVVLLRGALKQAQEEHGNYVKNMELRVEELKKSRTAFLHSGVFSSKKKLFEQFMARVQRYYSDDSRIKMLEKLESMIRVMITQFTKLYESCFAIYAEVTQNLIDTFHENYQTLSTPSVNQTISDPFIIPLMKIEDMRESLDSTVDAMNLGNEMSAFHTYLFEKFDAWNNGEEKKIAKSVSQYLIKKFSGYTEKTLTDYLQIRFGTIDAAQLEVRVYQDILRPLSDKATPLFWKEPAYDITMASPLGYCCVPDGTAFIQAAASRMTVANPELQQVTSRLADRIFLLRCTCGVPMFAYNGIESYSGKYRNDKEKGKHLYERTERDQREWRNLPELIPFSKVNNRTEKMNADSQIYEEAVAEEIIRQRPGLASEYHVVVMPDTDQIIQYVQSACDSKNQEKCEDAKKKLEEFIMKMEPVRYISVPNDGMQGHEETVRKDHVMASQEVMNILIEEIEKKKNLKQAEQNIQIILEGTNDTRKKKQQYFDALMTGVIVCKGRVKVLYQKEEGFGLMEEIVLSEPSMKPFGSFAPVYQAFKTFFNMDQEDYEAIVKTSEERKDNIAPELKEACDQLERVFAPDYVKMIKDTSKNQAPESAEEIKGFIKEFMTALSNFRLMYSV